MQVQNIQLNISIAPATIILLCLLLLQHKSKIICIFPLSLKSHISHMPQSSLCVCINIDMQWGFSPIHPYWHWTRANSRSANRWKGKNFCLTGWNSCSSTRYTPTRKPFWRSHFAIHWMHIVLTLVWLSK